MPSAVATTAAGMSLKRMYGDNIVVQHHSVDDPAVQTAFAGLLEYIAAEKLPLPVAVLDHEILFVGGVQPLKLVAAVAQHLAQHGITPQA